MAFFFWCFFGEGTEDRRWSKIDKATNKQTNNKTPNLKAIMIGQGCWIQLTFWCNLFALMSMPYKKQGLSWGLLPQMPMTQILRDSLDLNKYLKTPIINIWWDIYIWRPVRLWCTVTIPHWFPERRNFLFGFYILDVGSSANIDSKIHSYFLLQIERTS